MNRLKTAADKILFSQSFPVSRRNGSPLISAITSSSTSVESDHSPFETSADSPPPLQEPTGNSYLADANSWNAGGNRRLHCSNSIPKYVKRIPEEIAKAFETKGTGLKETDAEFRKLVKHHCKLPAYFGVVMIQRIQEYRKVVADLVLEQQLSPDCLDYIPEYCESISPRRQQKEKQKIGLRDFLRFWTPEIRTQNRVCKFLRIISPPTRENILALERDEPIPQGSSLQKRLNLRFLPQELHKEHLETLVEALVDRHPDLASLKHDRIQRRRYVATVSTTVFFRCTGNNSSSVPLRRVIESNLSSLFFRCATCSLANIQTFSFRFFNYVNEMFERCLVSEKKRNLEEQNNFGDIHAAAAEPCIRIESLKLENIFSVCQPAIFERLYLHSQRSQTNSKRGMQFSDTFAYEDLIRFMLAQEDQMKSFSLYYWFRLLDLDDDGYLSSLDLQTVYRPKFHIHGIKKESEKFKLFSGVFCSLLDLLNDRSCPSSQELLISPIDIRRSGGGTILFDLFIQPTTLI